MFQLELAGTEDPWIDQDVVRPYEGDPITLRYHLVRDLAALEQMVATCVASPDIAHDTETSGICVWLGARACGHAFAAPTGRCEISMWYVPIRHMLATESQLSPEVVFAACTTILTSPGKCYWAHGKFDWAMNRIDGIRCTREAVDVLIEANINDENEPSFKLKALAAKYCTEEARGEEKKLDDWMKKDAQSLGLKFKNRAPMVLEDVNSLGVSTYLERFGYSRTPIRMCGRYACRDVFYNLYLGMKTFRHVPRQWGEVYRREMLTAQRLHAMEWEGLPIDEAMVREVHDQTGAQVLHWLGEIRRLSDDPDFDPTDANVRELFYEKLKMVPPKWTKGGVSKKKQPAVDLEAREILKLKYPMYEPLITAVGRLSDASKYHTTYSGNFLRYLSADTGRIHPNYNQLEKREKGVPVTGRLSSQDPNVQNIAHKLLKVDLPGRETFEIAIRKYFKVPTGYIRAYIDFSQIELRVLAWFCQDENLIRAYQEGLDIHQITADLLGILRSIAKQVNFGNCLEAGTLVVTRRGLLSIEQVRVGDLVLTHKKRWRRVDEVAATPTRFAVRFETRTGKVVVCTPEHMLLVQFPAGGGYPPRRGWVYAQDIEEGQHLVYHESVYEPSRTRAIGEDEALAIGWWVSEGSWTRTSGFRIPQSREANPDVYYRMRKVLVGLGFREWASKKDAPMSRFYLPAAALVDFAKRTGLVQAGSREKSLPACVWRMPYKERLLVLGALWDGDGCCVITKQRTQQTYSTISRQLADDVVRLLDTVGINATIYRLPEKLVITVVGSQGKERFFGLVPTTKNARHDFPQKLKRFWAQEKIVSVKRLVFPTPRPFYDLAVREDHSFVANGIISHNSYGMTEIGLALRMPGYYADPEGTREEAKKVLYAFFQQYKRIKEFQRRLAEKMKRNGCLMVNPFGRPRRIPAVADFERWKRERGERQMMSSIISGTSADLMKECLIKSGPILEAQSPHSRLVQTVHDELVIDFYNEPGWTNALISIIRMMEDWPMFSESGPDGHGAGVPIRVACELTTTTWDDKREIVLLPDDTFQWKDEAT